ncbi:galactose-1-epimerase, partial [Phocaeicola vulgatus]
MKGKQGMVCMGLLLVLSSCHTGKQITASGLQRKDFQTEVNGQHT